MKPTRITVPLSKWTATLEMWSARTQEAHLIDILRVVRVLCAFYDDEEEQWSLQSRWDVEPQIWASFWRLVRASVAGSEIPGGLSFGDRMALLDAICDLNDLSEARKKLLALSQRNQRITEAMLEAQGERTALTSL